MTFAAAHEHRQLAAGDPGVEVLSFETVLADGRGLLVRWTLHGAGGQAEYWAVLASAAGPVVVREPDARAPGGRTLEVRADGLWADGVCEEPFVHWTLGLEAFAVRLDDPADGWHGERGERVPFGFELDWEATGEPAGEPPSYRQAGRLHGEVVTGRHTEAVDGPCVRLHRVTPHAADTSAGGPGAAGEVRVTDGRGVDVLAPSSIRRDDRGLPLGASTTAGEFTVTAAVALVAAQAPLALGAGRLASLAGDSAPTCTGWLEHRVDAS